MRKEKRRKKTLFFTLRGVHDFFSTSLLPEELEASIPSELREIEEVKSGEKQIWCRLITIQVNLLPRQQISSQHPVFVKRLVADIPDQSKSVSMLSCGEEEDFVEKLLAGEVSMGHLFEHVYAYFLVVRVLARFAEMTHILESPIHFRTFEPDVRYEKEVNEDFTLYHIALFYASRAAIPAEFFGIEERVCGYLDAKMRNQSFDIYRRVDNFVDHRTAELDSSRREFPKLPRSIRKIFRAAMLVFDSS